jgi:predicted transcriptional regulator
MHMRRTSILLDPGLLAELERISRRQGRPTAHAIREALEMYVEAHAGDGRTLPAGSQDGPATPTSASPADPDTAG